MEKIFQQALQDPSLRLLTKPEWGSQEPNHRGSINEQLRTLRGPLFSSISHAPDCGGFALSQFPIGFDVEKTARVRGDLVARISDPQELKNAPHPAALWCAKEASFKGLRHFDQPSFVSQIEIEFDLNPLTITGHSAWLFRVKNEKKFNSFGGIGAVTQDSSHTYCIMIFSP